jgi:hypothetical protein
MPTETLKPSRRRVGPYCKQISLGAVAGVDGRSTQGKFARRVEAELTAQIGGAPSFTQSILIRRIVRSMWQLEMLDAKFASGDWTAHDGRTQSGLANGLRLALRELGLKPVAPKAETLAEVLAKHAAPSVP